MNENNEVSESSESSESIKTQVIKFSITEQALSTIEDTYHVKNLPIDLLIKENYAMVYNAVSYIRKQRGAVENHRKDLKHDALEYGRKVDSAAREIKDRLLAVELPWKDAKTAHDTAIEIAKREAAAKEEARIDAINEKIANIKALVTSGVSADSTTIKGYLDKLENETCVWADEFTNKAVAHTIEVRAKLTELYELKLQSETVEIKQKEHKVAEAKKRERERIVHEAEQARQKIENERAAAAIKERERALQVEQEAFRKRQEATEATEKQKREDALRAENLAAVKAKRLADEEAAQAEKKETRTSKAKATIKAKKERIINARLASKQVSRFFKANGSIDDFIQAIIDNTFTFFSWIEQNEEVIKKATEKQKLYDEAEAIEAENKKLNYEV